MNIEQRQIIQWQCQQLALRVSYFIDQQNYTAMAELFTKDAIFARPTDPDNPIKGRETILAAFESRPKNRITRHICTNIIVDTVNESSATGNIYVNLITANTANEAENFGLNADPAQFMGEFRDSYTLTTEGWRVEQRLGNIVFTVK